MRRIVNGHYFTPDTARLGLAGRNEREAIALLRQADLACERLGGDEVEELLGEPLFGLALDPRPYVEQVESTVAEVRAIYDAHQLARRQVDQLLVSKNQAVGDYDVAFVRVARQFEDLCRLAELDDLADKVRPSLTRKGQTEVEPPDDEATPDGAAATVDDDAVNGDVARASDAADAEPEPSATTGAEPDVASGDKPAA